MGFGKVYRDFQRRSSKVQSDLGRANTQYDVAIVDLAIVQSHLAALIDFSGNEFRCTRDATAVPAAVRQIDALLAQ